MTRCPAIFSLPYSAPRSAPLQVLWHRKDPVRWFQMRPTVLARAPVALDVNSLVFLFDSPDPNLVAEVHLEMERHASARHLVDERNALHVGIAQPAVERALISMGGPTTAAFLEKACGDRVRDTLRGYTGTLRSRRSDSLTLAATSPCYRVAVSRLFPSCLRWGVSGCTEARALLSRALIHRGPVRPTAARHRS